MVQSLPYIGGRADSQGLTQARTGCTCTSHCAAKLVGQGWEARASRAPLSPTPCTSSSLDSRTVWKRDRGGGAGAGGLSVAQTSPESPPLSRIEAFMYLLGAQREWTDDHALVCLAPHPTPQA